MVGGGGGRGRVYEGFIRGVTQVLRERWTYLWGPICGRGS